MDDDNRENQRIDRAVRFTHQGKEGARESPRQSESGRDCVRVAVRDQRPERASIMNINSPKEMRPLVWWGLFSFRAFGLFLLVRGIYHKDWNGIGIALLILWIKL